MSRNEDTRECDIDETLATAARCRADASIYRQMGFVVVASWLIDNARAAERWATKR